MVPSSGLAIQSGITNIKGLVAHNHKYTSANTCCAVISEATHRCSVPRYTDKCPFIIMFSRAKILRFLLFSISCLTLFLVYYYLNTRPPYALYNQLDSQEIHHSEQLVQFEEKKYVMFRQLRGAGFNNQVCSDTVDLVGLNHNLLQVQDILLYHNLALAASRTYVYQPFVWRPRGEKSYVPLSAFLVGVTKNSISSKVFHKICPESDIVHLSLSTESAVQWQHALEMLAGDERCVMIDDWIFNWTYVDFFVIL